MFSNRTRWDRTRNRVARLLEAKRAAGADVVDLTETNPTAVGLCCPPRLLELLGDPDCRRYEPQPLGLPAAREAVARDFARRGARVAAEQVALTASTSEAYAYLFKMLCDPGEVVLVPRPSYPLFEFLAQLESVHAEPYPLEYDGAWGIDLAAVAEAAHGRARALVVVNPNNPTGSFVRPEEVEALRELCAERRLALVSDEVFADYALVPDGATTLAGDSPALTFCLGGLSKSCGLPQLKLGWVAVCGPQAERTEALARLEIVADTYLSVAAPIQRAAPAILAALPDLQQPIRQRVERNLAALAASVPAGGAVSLLRVEGGWSAVLRVPAVRSEEDLVATLLEEDDVLVHPGYFFDFPSEAYVVLSLLPEPERFRAGLGRLLARAAGTPVL